MTRPLLPNSAVAQIRDLERRLEKLEKRPGGGGGGGGGLPSGGVAEDILVKLSSTNGDADWFSIVENGFSSRFGESVNITGVQDLFDYLFDITYLAPTFNPDNSVAPTTSLGISTFELGTTVGTDYTVSIPTIKKSNAITSVTFEFSTNSGSSWAPYGSTTPDFPNGGTETSDLVTADITATIWWRCTISDGTTTVTSAVKTITAVDNPPVINTFTSNVSTSTNREKTQDVLSPTFSVTVTKHTHNITAVVLKRNGSTIHTYSGLAGAGGTDNTFTDTSGLTDNAVYTLNVDDGVNSTVVQSITYNRFHYPVFYGVGAAGLNAAGIIAGLTKDLSMSGFASQSRSYTNGSGDDRMYLAVARGPTDGPGNWTSAYVHAIDPATNFDYINNFGSSGTPRNVTIDGATYDVYEYDFDLTPSTFTLNWS